MICEGCGERNRKYDQFCSNCGTKLEPTEQARPRQPSTSQSPPTYTRPQAYSETYTSGGSGGYELTGQLNLVVVGSWIFMVVELIHLLIYLVSNPPVGILLGIGLLVMLYSINGISKYDSTSKRYHLGALALVLLLNLIFSVIGWLTFFIILFGLYSYWVLLFHDETVYRFAINQ